LDNFAGDWALRIAVRAGTKSILAIRAIFGLIAVAALGLFWMLLCCTF
jgi:hypothetical protein